MHEVRRDDGELCGHVARVDGRWVALIVFGVTLAEFETEAQARDHVGGVGLEALADRWTLIDSSSGDEQVVLIQEASSTEVSLALGYYALPGVATMTVRVDELRSGRWRLEHRT